MTKKGEGAERTNNTLNDRQKHLASCQLLDKEEKIKSERMSYADVAAMLSEILEFTITADNVKHLVQKVGVIPPWELPARSLQGTAWLFDAVTRLHAERDKARADIAALQEQVRALNRVVSQLPAQARPTAPPPAQPAYNGRQA